MTSAPPPGWYDDDTGRSRWWDGKAWWNPAEAGQDPAGHVPPPDAALATPDTTGATPTLSPGPGPVTPPNSGRRSWWVVAGVVALLGMVAAVWVLTRQVGSEPEARTPEDTVLEFYDAYKAGSCERTSAVLTEHYIEESGSSCSEFEEHPDALAGVEPTLGELTINADGSVAVPIFLAEAGQDPAEAGGFVLIQVDGTWLIDDSWGPE